MAYSPARRRRRPQQHHHHDSSRSTTGRRTRRVTLVLLALFSVHTTAATRHAPSVSFSPGRSNIFQGVGDDSPLARTMKGAAGSAGIADGAGAVHTDYGGPCTARYRGALGLYLRACSWFLSFAPYGQSVLQEPRRPAYCCACCLKSCTGSFASPGFSVPNYDGATDRQQSPTPRVTTLSFFCRDVHSSSKCSGVYDHLRTLIGCGLGRPSAWLGTAVLSTCGMGVGLPNQRAPSPEISRSPVQSLRTHAKECAYQGHPRAPVRMHYCRVAFMTRGVCSDADR